MIEGERKELENEFKKEGEKEDRADWREPEKLLGICKKKKKKLSKLQVEYSNGIKMSEVLDILSCKKYVFFHVPLNVYQDKRNMPTEIFQIPFTAI